MGPEIGIRDAGLRVVTHPVRPHLVCRHREARGLYIGAAERPENRLGDSLCLIEAVSLVPAHLVPNVGDRGAEVVTHPWIQRNPVGLIGQLVAVDPDAEPSAELAPD